MLPAADLTEILANLAALQLAPAAQILAAVFAPLLRRLGSRAPAAARRTAAVEVEASPAAEAEEIPASGASCSCRRAHRWPRMSFDEPKWRRDWLRGLQRRASVRADRAGPKFDLKNPEHAAELYNRQDGCCAVSGVKFNLERFDDALVKHPFAPSIDRILSSGGHTEDNVRLVCVAVNFGMGQWGQEVYMTLARAAVAREAKEQSNPDPSGDSDWHVRQREKIAAAEALRDAAAEPERTIFDRRVRALKRNQTLGPEGLRRAACRARKTRQQRAGKR